MPSSGLLVADESSWPPAQASNLGILLTVSEVEYRITESSAPCVKVNGGVDVSDADSCDGFAGLLPVAAPFFLLLVGIGDGERESKALESVWSLLLLGIDAKSSGPERLLLRAKTIFNQWLRDYHNGTIRERLVVNNLIGGISSTTDEGNWVTSSWFALIDEGQSRLLHALHAPIKGLAVRGSNEPCALKQNKKKTWWN